MTITGIDRRVRNCAGPCRAPLAAAAAAGVVLRVADRIVRVGLDVAAGEDLGGPRRRGTYLLIGVAAREGERRDRDDDGDPYGCQSDERWVDTLEREAIGLSFFARAGWSADRRLPSHGPQ